MSFRQAMMQAFPRVLFLMLVCLGFLALVAFPLLGERLGPLVCEEGETIRAVTERYSLPGESGTTTEYFCEGPSGSRAMGTMAIVFAALKVYVALFLIIIWPVMAWRSMRKVADVERLQREGIPAEVEILSAEQTSWLINDIPVVKLEIEVRPQDRPSFRKKVRRRIPEMMMARFQPGSIIPGLLDPRSPREVLLQLEKAVPARIAALSPEISEAVKRAMGSTVTMDGTSEDFGGSAEDLDALRALKAMLDEDLISSSEYEAKKAEIMARL